MIQQQSPEDIAQALVGLEQKTEEIRAYRRACVAYEEKVRDQRVMIQQMEDQRDAALALLQKVRCCVEWARDECETPELRAELTDRLREIDKAPK